MTGTLANLLIYRWILVNIAIGALLVLPFTNGYAQQLFREDTSYISHGIAVFFAVAWLATAYELFRVSFARNDLARMVINGICREHSSVPPILRDKACSKIVWLSNVSEWLVGLGLLGTVIGFSIALTAVDQGSLASAEGVQTSIARLMAGMRIAINTTIVGAITGMWLEINYRMLRTAVECFWADRQL